MTKDERHALAKIGVQIKLGEMEATLGEWFKDYPDLFVGRTRPLLLRPELKNGNGHTFSASFVVAPHANGHGGARVKGQLSGTSKLRAQREKTAQLLELIAAGASTKDQLLAAGVKLNAVGGLVRRGYLKNHKKTGFTRTAKPFEVDPKKAFKEA